MGKGTALFKNSFDFIRFLVLCVQFISIRILIKFQDIKLDLVDGNNSDSISRPSSTVSLALSFSLCLPISSSCCRTFSCSINNDITDIARSLFEAPYGAAAGGVCSVQVRAG